MRFQTRMTALMLCAQLLGSIAWADEGMWTYDHFPAKKMRAAYGWAPDAAWLKNAQLSSIRLAQGCSASLVSPDGLVMTNHHCARECISELADSTHDFIKDGFYAQTLKEERKCPALEANQLTEITDVTARMKTAIGDKSDRILHEAERAEKAKIESACGTSQDIRCEVVKLYHGGVYNLYKYRRYQDIRLVFAPEVSAAFFGGDPDNFTYPRFDLDLSFVRIYDHDRPLKNANYLRFSTQGVKAGDIAITSGNPGGTDREDTLAQMQFERDVRLPFALTYFSELRGVLNQYATQGPEYARTSEALRFDVENALKAYKGMQLALVHGSLMSAKAQSEHDLRARIAANPESSASTAGAWDAIEAAMAHFHGIFLPRFIFERSPGLISPLLSQAIELNRYAAESRKPNGERLEEYSDANFPALQQDIESSAPIYPQLEKTILRWWLTKMREDLGTNDQDAMRLIGKQSPEEIASALVDGTKLADAKLRHQLLAGGAQAIDAYHDPLIDFARKLDVPARAARADYENNVAAILTKNADRIAKSRFVLEGTGAYPDATFTLRLSYGVVSGYREGGRDVEPTTTFAGAFAHATGRDPFMLPPSWLTAQQSIDATRQLDFVSNNDIIGGNSGSPVIGRNGEVIGLVFDGNIQSLGADYGFDAESARCVAVDVTAIAEALKHIYHADRLAAELASHGRT